MIFSARRFVCPYLFLGWGISFSWCLLFPLNTWLLEKKIYFTLGFLWQYAAIMVVGEVLMNEHCTGFFSQASTWEVLGEYVTKLIMMSGELVVSISCNCCRS